MRRLTLDEAEQVSASAREPGERPTFYNATTRADEEISQEFEAYLILTPSSVRSEISTFFQTILDNDPNNVQLREQLLSEFLEEELRNASESQRVFSNLTEYYDSVRTSLSSSVEGFEDVTEVPLLQEATTSSMGDIVSTRDRHQLDYAVLRVLQTRAENGRSATLTEELRSWVRVLTEYE